MNWSEFFAMGGYAFYVWTAYAVAAVVLAFNVLLPLRRRKTVHHALRGFYRLTTPGMEEAGGVGNKPPKGEHS